MNCPHESLIDDFVDGALTQAAASAFEVHLDGCVSCTRAVSDLRAIRTAASMLPQHPVPPRVWAQIDARLGDRRASTPASRLVRALTGLGGAGWLPLAAAACLLVLAVGVWWLWMPRQANPAEPATGVGAAATEQSVDGDVQLAQDHYETAIAGLQEIAAADRASLDPQTSAVLDSSLSVIDQAIDESRAALDEQPANEAARESLFEALRSKVVLLQDTVALINEMRKGDQDGVARVISGLNQ